MLGVVLDFPAAELLGPLREKGFLADFLSYEQEEVEK